MDYDVKANVTTVISFLLLPVLAGLGVDAVTSSALVGLVGTLVFFVLMYLNERYLSNIFTKSGYSVQKNCIQAECTCEEDAINPEYYDEGV